MFFILFPFLRNICRKMVVIKTTFKLIHLTKCQLAFNFTRGLVQAHYD